MSAVNPFPNYSPASGAPTCPACGESVRLGDTSCEFCFARLPKLSLSPKGQGQSLDARPQDQARATYVSLGDVGKTLWHLAICLLAGAVWLTLVAGIGAASFIHTYTKRDPEFARIMRTLVQVGECKLAKSRKLPPRADSAALCAQEERRERARPVS
jgi:hypothetical protein